MNTDEYCQYCTRLDQGIPILLHSVIYERPDPYTLKPVTYNYLARLPLMAVSAIPQRMPSGFMTTALWGQL